MHQLKEEEEVDLVEVERKELEQIKFKKLSPDAILPTKSTATDGFIFYSIKDYTIPGFSDCLIDTGISLSEIHTKRFFSLTASYGRGGFYEVQPLVGNGLYDSSFKSSMLCKLHNFGHATCYIKKGEKICQGTLVKKVYSPR